MILIVGLGNPGERYLNTRHNIGFMLLDLLIKEKNPSKIKLSCDGELYKDSKYLYLKPQTFMNNSGISVAKVVDFYKVERIIVCHDEMDIDFCRIKIKKAGSSGGHNGLKSIDKHIGNNYERLRIGIGRPQNKEDVINFVLAEFNKDEKEKLSDFLDYCKNALVFLLNNNIQESQNKFH